MRRFMLSVVLLLGITTVSIASVEPVNADVSTPVVVEHNWDSLAWSTCYAERVDWTSYSSIQHAHPADLTTTYVDYHCCAEVYNLSHRWYFATRNTAGYTWSHNWSPVYGDECP